MERKLPNQKMYDWPELRGLIPNASSPQPRLAMATYGAKAAPSGSSVQPATQILSVQQQPKKPVYAWHRNKQNPTVANPNVTQSTTSPSTHDLSLESFAPPNRSSTIAVRRELSHPTYAATQSVDAPLLPVLKRTINKNPPAMLKRINDGEVSASARGDASKVADVRHEPSGKQWVFQMPTALNSNVPPAPEHSGSDDEGVGSLRQIKSTSRPAANLANASASRSVHWQDGTTAQHSQVRKVNTKRRPPDAASQLRPNVKSEDLQIEGSAYSDGNVPTNALLALETHVARERRAREELSYAHRQVLLSFRQVVRVFFATVVDDQHMKRGPAAVSLAKCSVVVHTLVTTIQSYARAQQSQRNMNIRRFGPSTTSLAVRLHLSHKMLPPLLDVDAIGARGDDTPITAGGGTTATSDDAASDLSTSRSSVHDVLLDHQTISRLKQLYFDYYDCETFVLEGGARAVDSTTKFLSGERHEDMRHLIEEKNVLEEVAEDDAAPQTPMWQHEHHEDPSGYIPEELPTDTPPAGRQQVASRIASAVSIAFNESHAMRDIFGSPRTASDLGSPCSYIETGLECEEL
jgi:hypothetical protein